MWQVSGRSDLTWEESVRLDLYYVENWSVLEDLLIDAEAGIVQRGGHAVEVTATERRLLHYLAENRERVVSPTSILTQVWGYDAYDPNLVEVHVSALRRKLEAHGPLLITDLRPGHPDGSSAARDRDR